MQRRAWPLSVGWWTAGAVALVLIAWADSPWLRYLGRLHPLAVHLPIGILALVAAAEAATPLPRFRDRIDPITHPALVALAAASIAAAIFGLWLERGGHHAEQPLLWHRRLMLAAVGASLLCLAAWRYHQARDARRLYRATLAATGALFATGAHFGGSLTHGEGYFTRSAPWLDPEPPSVAPVEDVRTVFAAAVAPILRDRCQSCHGPEDASGGLRIDSLAALHAGGDSGAAVIAGAAATSPLIQRISLPEGHPDRMPPEGEPPLTAAEIALLRWWVDRGASGERTLVEALPPPAVIEALTAARDADPLAEEIAASSEDAETAGGESSAETADDPTSDERSADGVGDDEAASAAAPASHPDWSAVAAILDRRCVSCHRGSRPKGGLRVDSLDALLAGGAGGPALVAGDPEGSLLVQRMRLPLDHPEHMPPSRRAQPSAEEVATIAAFIGAQAPRPEARVEPNEPSEEARAESEPPEPLVPAVPPQAKNLYRDWIAPLLRDHCSDCHGGDAPMAGFAVDDVAALVERGLVLPGRGEESELWRRIALPVDHPQHMPPGEALDPMAVAAVRVWIDEGADPDGDIEVAAIGPELEGALGGHVKSTPGTVPAKHPPAQLGPPPGGCAGCSAQPATSPRWASWSAALLGIAWVLRRLRRPTERPRGKRARGTRVAIDARAGLEKRLIRTTSPTWNATQGAELTPLTGEIRHLPASRRRRIERAPPRRRRTGRAASLPH